VPAADAPNRVWAVDFQFDSTTDGRPVKIVSIVGEHTRECLGGDPVALRCDNGPELACATMADWAGERVGLHFIPPGRVGCATPDEPA
jgi:putative transposase